MGASNANNVILQLPIVKSTDVIMGQALRQLATEIYVTM